MREKTQWARLWTKPQAVMWEAFEMFDQVAMYVRALVAAEKRDASVAARTLLLRQEDALGLSTAGLRVNRWIIAADEPLVADEDPDRPAPRHVPRGGTARSRLLGVIDGGA